jgi:putative transposase
MPTSAVVVVGIHRPIRYSGLVIVRYAYRIYPTPDQRQMLAKTFGCARRVYNDALQVWHDAWRCNVKISDSAVRARVTSEAKHTERREWLSEVSHVALGESFRDAARARKNYFDSRSGKRKGPLMGGPRRKSKKDKRQSFRLARNGFSLRPNGTLYLAKIGDVEVRWSRELPSVPSSVTVTREPDGRYYASFVVERDSEPLPAIGKDVGIDLGLTDLAVTSDGERVENVRPLRAKARNLARAQRRLAKKEKGSKNREKAAHKVAVIHRKIRNARADYLNKQALHLVRDNQAVYVEDLNVKGLARTRLAKSVHDASWGMLVRLLEEKAERYGRQVVKVDRWFPSSQLCSACGHRDGKKPLNVRSWTCPECGVVHHRDVNAARNILIEGRKTAAGLAVEVCGADVSPGLVPAVGDEAETRVA